VSERTISWASLAQIAVFAGGVAAAVEMMIVLPVQGALGANPEQVFQGIAAGALGVRAAFRGGAPAAALGVAVHLVVSIVAAGLYAWAAVRWPTLARRPLIWGPLYGVACYVVMNLIVIPLSRIGFAPPPSFALWCASFGVHLFFFGLPIALVVAIWRGYRFGRTGTAAQPAG
jgi:uncharacterized membrane protein YagU involved in acid resistance